MTLRASSTVATGSVVPGTIGTPAARHQLAGAGLGAHGLDRARRRADEDDPGLLAGLGEGRVLGEEAVAGVDRLGARLAGDLEDLLDVQVALGRRGAAQEVGLGRAADVQGVAVDLGVDGHRGDAELVQRAADADGDLAAVGDQDLREHGAGRLSVADRAAAQLVRPAGKFAQGSRRGRVVASCARCRSPRWRQALLSPTWQGYLEKTRPAGRATTVPPRRRLIRRAVAPPPSARARGGWRAGACAGRPRRAPRRSSPRSRAAGRSPCTGSRGRGGAGPRARAA